jgi:hypothetical protein
MSSGQILLAANIPVMTPRQVRAVLEEHGSGVHTATRVAEAVHLLDCTPGPR